MRLEVATLLALGLAAAAGQPVYATDHGQMGGQGPETMAHTMSPGLMMPSMDSAHGRKLFASKGCVVCHSVNGVGGEDAPPLDASTMKLPMNPFEFAAKMWRGAEAMVALQREELGEPIELTGQDLADIVAFIHHAEEQKKFTEADIPPEIKNAMEGAHDEDADENTEKKAD